MNELRTELFKRISDFMFASYRWGCMDSPVGMEPKPLGLSVDLLEYQRLNHPLYRKYCAMRGREARGVSLLDYPPLPVECFKHAQVCPFPEEHAVAEFHSSGTTEGVRSIHRFRDTSLMTRAAIYTFSLYVAKTMNPRTQVISLMPPAEDNPHSSLGFMISTFVEVFGAPGSESFFSMKDGLLFDRLMVRLEDCARQEIPVHWMGPAFAYVEILDRLGDTRIRCAPGSCLLETGGYKGKCRDIPKGELRDALSDRLGVERHLIYGEYGMCELSSQGYEISALNTDGRLPEEGLYVFPNWVKCVLFNPDCMRPVLPGNEGQIALFDLCNLDSAAFILTGDIGRLEPLSEPLRACVPGHPKYALRLLGRASDAMPKGCSISWDEWNRKK